MTPPITRRKFLKFLALGAITIAVPGVLIPGKTIVFEAIPTPPLSAESIMAMYDEILVKFYLPGIKEQFEQEPLMFELFNKCETRTKGKNAVVEMNYGRS